MLLKYEIFLDTPCGQYMVDLVIRCLSRSSHLKEYTQKFRVLSDSHRLMAKRTYVEFFFTGLTCPDVARHIASFV